MKTEPEIRQHLRDLLTLSNVPCDCAQTGHTSECEGGKEIFATVKHLLAWVLNENDQFQAIVDNMHRRAEKVRRGPAMG